MDKLKYNHASAAKMSAPAPCTNHLVECAHCPPEAEGKRPVIWSYNLAKHYAKEHPSHPLPNVATITPLEKGFVRVVGGEGKTLSAEQKRELKEWERQQQPVAPAHAAPPVGRGRGRGRGRA